MSPMKKITLPKFLIYTIVVTLLGCGAATIGPAWFLAYDHTLSNIYSSTDGASFYLVNSSNRDTSFTIDQFDYAGNLLNHHTYNYSTEGYTLRKLQGDAIYVRAYDASIETMERLDLNTGEHHLAFSESAFDLFQSYDLTHGTLNRNDDLPITGHVVTQAGQAMHLIGKLTPDGQFDYTLIPDVFLRTAALPMLNGDNFVVVGIPSQEYRESNNIRTILIFFDSALNPISRLEFEDVFITTYALNNEIYGYFSTGENRGGTKRIDQTGTIAASPLALGRNLYPFGSEYYYTVKYEEDYLRGHRKVCRHRFTGEQLNCFNVSNEENYSTYNVTPDGGFAITDKDYDPKYVYESVGITAENVEQALLTKLEVRGYESRDYRQRIYSPQGKLLLQSKPVSYKKKGHFELCNDNLFGFTTACLVEEYREAGERSLNRYGFLGQGRLVTITTYCDENGTCEYRLNFWDGQANP